MDSASVSRYFSFPFFYSAEKSKPLAFLGHIVKLSKLGIGMPNTHSNHGDGRMETIAALTLEAGASIESLISKKYEQT
jgi:cobalamin biosynthesis protein CbiD